MKNVFIQVYPNQWKEAINILKTKLSFEKVELDGKPYPFVPNAKVLFQRELSYIRRCLAHYKQINHANIVISPNYLALFLLVCKKLRILKIDTLCWFGMFIHNPRILKAVGRLVKFFYPKNESLKIIVFSSGEIGIYSKAWKIDEGAFIYVPYGDWNNETKSFESKDEGDYFFSGGYSNRDYTSLIKIFEKTGMKLVIVASNKNTDLVEYIEKNTIPSNISVFFDLLPEEFNQKLMGSKAVIFHMKHNTGASGQMVALNAMRNHKLIIASHTDVLDDYFTNMNGAIVYEKEEAETVLPEILKDVHNNFSKYKKLTEDAYLKYEEEFSYEGLSKKIVVEISRLL